MSYWHDFVTIVNRILGHFPDNAKPVSRRMRSRCQYYSATPMLYDVFLVGYPILNMYHRLGYPLKIKKKGTRIMHVIKELIGKLGIAFSDIP